jgi:hypothetical protein
MADITITVNAAPALAALRALSGPGMQGKMTTALREAALFGERTVVGFTPVKTGALRASITNQQQGALGWRIFSPLTYAPMVEGGTRPHTITPRGKFLRFVSGGSVVYARRVAHPGTKAHRMFARAVPAITAQLPAIVARALGK